MPRTYDLDKTIERLLMSTDETTERRTFINKETQEPFVCRLVCTMRTKYMVVDAENNGRLLPIAEWELIHQSYPLESNLVGKFDQKEGE